MTTRNQINSNFWQIANTDANGTITGITVAAANLGTVANVEILGGLNGQFLQTDGTGNLTWANAAGGTGNGIPGGANTQLQYNNDSAFGGIANITYNNITDTLSISTASANLGAVGNLHIQGGTVGQLLQTDGAGNLSWVSVGAATYSNANVANYLPTYTGNFTANVITANAITAQSTANLGAVSNVTITGGFPGQFLATDGAGGLSWTTPVAGGAVANLSYSTEVVTLISPPVTTYNYDVAVSSVKYAQLTGAGDIVINFRGSTTQTLTSLVAAGTSATVTYVMTTGAVAYGVTAVSIDGVQQVIRWSGGAAPIPQSNSLLSYTFTLIKTSGTPSWTVLGALTRYA